MAFFDRSYDDIVSSALDRLSSNTNITQLSPGSKARFFLETVSKEQTAQHKVFDTNLLQTFIKYADGRMLDFFGDMLNLPRNEASHATVDDENFMFYVSSGTFGDINNSTNFVIPAGTTVSTVAYASNPVTPGISAQPIIQYTTTASVTALANQSFVYAPIRAVVEGDAADLPKNVLNQHDFTSYVDQNQGSLKSTNRYAIANGEDRETNDSYRYRLGNIFRSRSLAVLASIRIASLSIPGVTDITEVEAEQGPGTFSIYVKSTTPTTSPRLLQEVAAVIDTVRGYGNRPFILAPEPIGLEFVAAVFWSPRATAAQKTAGYNAMRDALENTLNKSNIGEAIELTDLIDIMLSAAPLAQSIGSANSNFFEEVYVYRRDPITNGTVRNSYAGTEIIPLYNERVILETSNRYRGIQFLTR